MKKGNIILHLSEHHGDASPGSGIFTWGEGVAEYHKELIDKNYKYTIAPDLKKHFMMLFLSQSMTLLKIKKV